MIHGESLGVHQWSRLKEVKNTQRKNNSTAPDNFSLSSRVCSCIAENIETVEKEKQHNGHRNILKGKKTSFISVFLTGSFSLLKAVHVVFNDL